MTASKWLHSTCHMEPPPPQGPPGNSRVHPPRGVWTWTEAHVGNPSPLTQDRRGVHIQANCGVWLTA